MLKYYVLLLSIYSLIIYFYFEKNLKTIITKAISLQLYQQMIQLLINMFLNTKI